MDVPCLFDNFFNRFTRRGGIRPRLKAASSVFLAFSLVFSAISMPPAPSAAQNVEWCAPDGLDDIGNPYPPRPYWGQLKQIPDYADVMNNFNVAKSIRLLVSVLEKSLNLLETVTGDDPYGPDTDGFCLCDCSGNDAQWWINYILGSLKNNLEASLLAAKNAYVSALIGKLEALKQVVLDTLPNFKADLATAIQNACNAALSTECDFNNPGDTLLAVANQLADVAKAEIESIFNAEKDQALDLLMNAANLQGLQAQLDNVIAELPNVLKFKFKELGQELDTLFGIVKNSIADVLDAGKAIATSYSTGDLIVWKNQVLAAVQAEVNTIFANSTDAWNQLQADIEAAVQARISAIKGAIDDVFVTATNLEGPFDVFVSSFQAGLLADLTNVGGCYGTTKRSKCNISAGNFCEGTSAATLPGGIDVPLWFPTDVFKDGKTALLFALKHVGFLEKVADFLNQNAPGWMGVIGTWIDGLKNALEVLDKIAKYVNTFTDGFHLGAYSEIRPDLHMCVGYAGHGAMAQVFSFSIGNNTVSGGASYASHNLTKNYRAQFRSGGFAVDINGKTLQLAPGISLNTQMDGWRMWDKKYPFGLGRNADGSFWNNLNPGNWSFSTTAVNDFDVFNLVDQTGLEALCPGGSGPCNLTLANFLYNGFYPVDYTASGIDYEWPREGIEWEQKHRATAVFGAGLNLDFEMKQYRWDITPSILLFAPPPVWLTPWLSLDAGVGWKYEAYYLRGTIQDKLNANLPASAQLTSNDFRRDKFPASSSIYNGEPFQAPDVTEDMGTNAFVEPRVGADLDIGLKIAKFLKIGITVSISIGLRADVGGYGGILDLNRALVDALAQSNPPGNNCNPVIENKVDKFCTNVFYKKDAAGEACADDPDCIDMSPGDPNPNQGPYSTQTYSCDDNSQCSQFGYCLREKGGIMAHDVKREDCEGTQQQGGCEAVYIENPCGCGVEWCFADALDMAMMGPPFGFCSSDPGQADLAEAIMMANQEASGMPQEMCENYGWCYNWVPNMVNGVAVSWRVGLVGVAPSAAQCPPASDGNGKIITYADGTPVKSQFVPFKWTGSGSAAGGMGGTWYPYQCHAKITPTVTGWSGPDCNPVEFGYPSACGCFDNANCSGSCAAGKCSETPATGCTCNPTGGATCPSGRVCIEGACMMSCSTDADCGPHRVCNAGGCVMENGVPYAEQIIWNMRNVAQPMHVVASYALNKLVVSAVLGVGITIGVQYKIFKKWREKVLWKWNKDFPLLSMPFVKFQLGLEAQYQDDCPEDIGTIFNHQPGKITRPAALSNGTLSRDLVEWCKPSLKSNVVNPPSPDDPSEVIGQGLEDVHNWGYDLGLDLWYRNQFCIDGVVWYEYMAMLGQNPEALWGVMEATYYGFDGVHDLDTTGPQELLGTLMTALGCLDTNANAQNNLLFQLLAINGLAGSYVYTYTPMFNGSPSGPPRNVLDWAALFLDLEEELNAANVDPTVLGFNNQSPFGILGPKFFVSSWLAMLDQCISDIEDGGKYVDANLDLRLELNEADMGPCADPCDGPNADPDKCPELGACCTPAGQCAFTSKKACVGLGGQFTQGASCSQVQCGSSGTSGACCLTSGGCVPATSAQACQGSFQPGKSCADVFSCEGKWACCVNGSCTPATAQECWIKKGIFTVGKTCAEIGSCTAPLGACCKPDGTCDNTTTNACEVLGGSFQAGQDCSKVDLCTQAITGACCLPTGCSQQTAAACLQAIAASGAGKFWPGQTCTQVNCGMPGQCCLPTGQCASLTSTGCSQQGGNWFGTQQCIAGQNCVAQSEVHACCLPSGACSNLTSAQCKISGGSLNAGQVCSAAIACPSQPVGACCLPTGGCAVLTVGQCEGAGGTGFQEGATCENTQLSCGATKYACCLPDGTCADLSNKTCKILGGVSNLAASCNTPGFMCPSIEPFGGCCLPTGQCVDTTSKACKIEGGAFYNGQLCSSPDLICIDVTAPSACCIPGVGCQMVPQADCAMVNGQSYPGLNCKQVDCPVAPMDGACCVGDSCIQTSNIMCAKRGGIFHAGLSCKQVKCYQMTGACCLGDTCEQLTATQCSKKQKLLGIVGGFYPGMACNQVPCGKLGACCLPSDQCVQTTEYACNKQNGAFSQGLACSQVDCCPDLKKGACCVDGNCYELPKAHCSVLGGGWQTESCDKVQCCAQEVPKVACCLATGCVDMTPEACNALGGSAGGPGSVCAGMSIKGCLIALPVTLETAPLDTK